MNDTLKQIEEDSYKIAESVRVPDAWDIEKEMTLFDFQMEEGREEEGIELAKKIQSYVKSSITKVLQQLVEREEKEKQPLKVSENREQIMAWNNKADDTISNLKSEIANFSTNKDKYGNTKNTYRNLTIFYTIFIFLVSIKIGIINSLILLIMSFIFRVYLSAYYHFEKDNNLSTNIDKE